MQTSDRTRGIDSSGLFKDSLRKKSGFDICLVIRGSTVLHINAQFHNILISYILLEKSKIHARITDKIYLSFHVNYLME